MINKVLIDGMIDEQAFDYITEEVNSELNGYRAPCKKMLGIFEKAIVEQEKYLFEQLLIVDSSCFDVELKLIMGNSFEEVSANIWITSNGYAVVSENSRPMRCYKFQSALEENAKEIRQLSAEARIEEDSDEIITNLSQMISLYEEYGVKAVLIDDELLIKRLNNQIPSLL